jgi:4'-phosphopantetheinyl transferase
LIGDLEPGEVHVFDLLLRSEDAAARKEECRRALRVLLAGYARVPADALALAGPPGAKPRVANAGLGWLRFSASRSDRCALVAVARGRDVGVDIERVDTGRALETIADRLFPQEDAARLRALPPGERASAFFALWTRKEAVLKALGAGLGALADAEGLGRHMEVVDLPAPAGYRAALAVHPPLDRVRRTRVTAAGAGAVPAPPGPPSRG